MQQKLTNSGRERWAPREGQIRDEATERPYNDEFSLSGRPDPAPSIAVELKEYSPKDREAVLQLKLREDQKKFVGANSLSIEQATEFDYFHLMTIRDKNDNRIVGVVLYAFDSFPEEAPRQWWLYRIMIDEEFQHRSYGTQALKALGKHLADKGVTELFVPVCEGNTLAREFYGKNGYVETNKVIEPDGIAADLDREVVYSTKLTK